MACILFPSDGEQFSLRMIGNEHEPSESLTSIQKDDADSSLPIELSHEHINAKLTSLGVHIDPIRLPANIHLPSALSEDVPEPLHQRIMVDIYTKNIVTI